MLPLEGIRVLALENYYAGNVGSLTLVRFGAEVIKVEMPGIGDAMRDTGPHAEAHGRKRNLSELRVMGGKQSVAIDMSRPEGLDLIWRLVAVSDVVWTNMKPSSLQDLGISYEALRERNPQIVYTTLSGFGHGDLVPEGPFGSYTAFDLIAQGLAGLQFRAEGQQGRPGYNGLALGDQVSAMNAVLGTVLALLRRCHEPGPQRVDVAMHDSMVMLNELSLGLTAFTGQPPPRGRSGTSAPYGAYRTADGYVNIAIGSSPIWRRFCVAISRHDLLDDPKFAQSAGRVAHFEQIDAAVETWTRARKTTEVVDLMLQHTIPCAPIFDMPDVIRSPQVAARNMLIDIDDPTAGKRAIVGNPIKMSGCDDKAAGLPPDRGDDTRAVLQTLLGLTPPQVAELSRIGAIEVPDHDASYRPRARA